NAVSDLILTNDFVQAEKLATPNTPTLTASPDGLAINGEWQKVDKATSYEVQLYKDGTAITGEGKKTTDQLSCDFAPIMVTNGVGSYTVDVKAIGNGSTTIDSEKSPQSVAFEKKSTKAGYFSIAPQEYTGSALTADIQVTTEGTAAGIVNVADHFTVTNNTTTEVSTPAHKVTLSPKSGSHFVGEVQLDFAVTQKPVTITGITATAKAYDGTNNVKSASFLANAGVIAGKVVSDDVSVDVTTATGTTPNKNVGENIPVTMAGVKLGGTKAGNYTLSAQPTDVKIKVTAIDLTVEGLTFADKVYDGTADATISGTPTLAGVIEGDAVALKATDFTKGTFASSDAAKDITVNLVTPMGIEGADIGNYNLIAPVGKAAITAQATAVAPMTVELKKGNTAQQSVSFE
ncbi:MAG: YDG domain-containing protein, partial [Oscillospiraceae bacterium]